MGKKFALLIGNNEYDDPTLSQLRSPPADVETLAELLGHKDVGCFDYITTLINHPWADTQTAIADFFAEKHVDDTMLLYFSGHGMLDEQGRLYLAMRNTRRNLLSGTSIASRFIVDEMDSSRSKRQVLILDCCYSGAFSKGTKGISNIEAVNQSTFEGTGRGRVILTASGATQFAWDGNEIIGSSENSLFTYFLLEGLSSGKADLDGDSLVSVDEWYKYAYDEITDVGTQQTPRMWSYNLEGNIVIARVKKSTSGASPSRLPFTHGKFVDRKHELEKIFESVHKYANDQNFEASVPNRFVILGAPGLGKSWLLQEIRWQFEHRYPKNAKAIYIDINQLVGLDDDKFTLTIIKEILVNLGTKQGLSKLPIDELSLQLIQAVKNAPTCMFVFLFDNVDETDNPAYEMLEQQFLRSLGVLSNVVLVFASRNSVRTNFFELRMRTHEITLSPFDIENTRKQLELQVPAASRIAEYVHRLSNGHLWANYLYGQTFTASHKLDNLENTIFNESAISGKDRELMEALCVLRRFSIDLIIVMAKAYFGDVSQINDPRGALEILHEMSRTGVIVWRNSGGYTITEPMRTLFEENLKTRDISLWRRLNLAAYEYYCKQFKSYPEKGEHLKREAIIHSYKLELAGYEPPDCFQEE